MSSAPAQCAVAHSRSTRAVRVAVWLTPLVVLANLVLIAGMGATTDDPGNLIRPFNWLGYAVEAVTAAELLAVGVAALATARFGTRGAGIARWSARLALTLGIAILAVLAWLIA